MHCVADPFIEPEAAEFETVRRALDGVVLQTPMRRLHWLERWVGVPVWAKLENYQHTGSFKFRGAYNRLRQLSQDQRVVTASAGNHGLAMAEVARRLGMPNVLICVPANSSPLKREKIINCGVGVTAHGGSLEEATRFAKEFADREGYVFVSPYNDRDVILGQATLAMEMLDDIGAVSSLVVPVGGGGLISGMALGARAMGSACEIIGAEPDDYASMSESLLDAKIRRVPNRPTLADGLAVNLEADSVTFNLVRRHVTEVLRLSEEELAAGTMALLVHEGLMVEPSGAAGIMACLRLAERGQLKGSVALPLAGGNLHHTVLARLQRWPFRDETCLSLLDMRGRGVAMNPVPRTMRESATDTVTPAVSNFGEDLARMLDGQLSRADRVEVKVRDFETFCGDGTLVWSPDSVRLVDGLIAEARDLAVTALERLHAPSAGCDAWVRGEGELRVVTQALSAAETVMEWRAPALDQSRAVQFFDLGFQGSGGVNYERYEFPELKSLENRLCEVLGLDTRRNGASVVSSGMAAYTLVESYLLHAVEPGAVVVSPYIYFEAKEQLQAKAHFRVHAAEAFDHGAILDAVARHHPRVVFADPLANNTEQRLTDIEALVEGMKAICRQPTVLVVDGTMLPGCYAHLAGRLSDNVEVLYYESGSKYLQFGQDLGMCGLVVHRAELASLFDRLRRNIGLILYRYQALCFPSYGHSDLVNRIRRIETNAARLAGGLATGEAARHLSEVIHPSLAEHPDHGLYVRTGRGGGCVTFRFHRGDTTEGHRDQLESFINVVLDFARASGVHLAKGVSFGFTIPRISAASSIAEDSPPFLRLYAGDLDGAQIEGLCTVIEEAFRFVRGTP